MNKQYVYYKEQCDYCINKGKCDYERKTRKFVETISGIESLASGVYGSLDYKCDYFDLDQWLITFATQPKALDKVGCRRWQMKN